MRSRQTALELLLCTLSSVTLVNLALLLSALSLLSAPTASASPLDKIDWQKIGDDLELGFFKSENTSFISSDIYFIRTKLRRFQIGVARAKQFGLRRAEVDFLCKKSHAQVCINANFFDTESNALGLVIKEGITHSSLHRGGKTLTGVFYVLRDKLGIAKREDIPQTGIHYAVQAGPRLVEDGKALGGFESKKSSSRRSGVCVDDTQQLILFASTPGFSGITLADLQTLLLSPQLRCVDALNFDGGGSSQLYIGRKLPGAPSSFKGLSISGRDKVPVALTLSSRAVKD